MIHPFVRVIILNTHIANSKVSNSFCSAKEALSEILHFCLESEIKTQTETWKIMYLHPHFQMEM